MASIYQKWVEESKSRIREITPEGVMQKLKAGEKFHLVDCREDNEWNAGHATGAVHVGRGVLERDIEEEVPGKSDPIVILCAGGARSALAAETLLKMGYTNVASMSGGMREWTQKGFPVSKD